MALRKPAPLKKIPTQTEILALENLWLQHERQDVKTHSEDLLTIFRSLGNPARMNIALALWDGPTTPNQLAFHADVTPSTISYHLAIMQQAGLVESLPNGRTKQIALTPLARNILLPAIDTLKGV